MMPEMLKQSFVMIGAGGHAKVLHELLSALGCHIVGVCDPQLLERGQTDWRGIAVFSEDEALLNFDVATVGLINGVGQLVSSTTRKKIYERFRQKGFNFPTLVHPAAWVATSANLAQGVQVMAGAIIQPDCWIGENSIVNSRASIDHDCVIGAHVHIAPGATLCGGIQIQDGAFIATGTTLIQGISVGANAVVSAGTTLTHDLQSNHTAFGIRASVRKNGSNIN